MAWRGGKWRGRLNQGQIEELAVQKVAEFRRRLQEADLSVPSIPPVPAEYIALTITELSVRGVRDLSHDGKPLSGLLDTEQTEILYDEEEKAARQSFTIAHELGHYFLHYLPAIQQARQPSLFDGPEWNQHDFGARLERAEKPTARYFRCGELAVSPQARDEPAEDSEGENLNLDEPTGPTRLGRRALEDPDTKAHLARIIRLSELAGRVEWEANIFARGLLMPSELVRWLNKKHAGEVEAIADELGVSVSALRYRLNGLGLRQDDNKGLLGPSYNSKPRSINPSQQGTFF